MRVSFIILSILLACVAGISAAEIKSKLIEDKSLKPEDKEIAATELQAIDTKDLDDEKEEGDEIKRKKKSATTTFCVEIRPSGDQKPFQVCEPGYASPNHYPPAPSYGSETSHVAPYQVATVNQPKPAAAYSAPVKTYAATPAAAASKPYTPHTSYGTYRSNDDMEAEERDETVMRTNLDSEEGNSAEETNMRSAYDHHYSPGYGVPSAGYAPAAHKNKYHHNGLVITCQPNLAGYAHNIPTYGHAPNVPSYNYRAASGRYGRPYQQYRPQQQPYGSYQHASRPAPKPVAYNQAAYSAPAAPSYPPQPAAYSQPHASHAYAPQNAAYRQPAYSSAGYTAPAAPVYSQKPQPQAYAAPPQQQAYVAPAQQQAYVAPAETPSYTAPAYHAAPVHHAASAYQAPLVPAYQAPAAPAYQAPAAPTPYSPPAPAAPAYAPSYVNPGYIPPGTYREAEEHDKPPVPTTFDKKEKESQTLKKMEEISEQRASGGRWGTEMASDSKDLKKDGQVSANGGWRAAGGPWGAEDAAKSDGGEHQLKQSEMARENEVDDTV